MVRAYNPDGEPRLAGPTVTALLSTSLLASSLSTSVSIQEISLHSSLSTRTATKRQCPPADDVIAASTTGTVYAGTFQFVSPMPAGRMSPKSSLTDRQQAASVSLVTDGPAELNRKLELRRRVVENTGEVWETVASRSKADAGQRGWQRVVMAGEVTARRSSEKPSRWSTSASSTEVGLSSDTPAGSSPVAARTPSPLKKKRPSLTPSTSGQSLLGAPRSEDGGPSAQCGVEPERTPCIAEGGSRGPEDYSLHVDAEVPEEHRELVTPRLLVFDTIPSETSAQTSPSGVPHERRAAVAVSMCTPRSARVVQDTLAHCEDLSQGIESPRLQVECLRQEVARLRELLEESERRCRVLAEHSDGFWEEEVYDIINKIHTTSHGMQQEDGHHRHQHHHHGQRNGLPGRLWRWLSCSRLLP
ncbi:hypothetical protein FOZ63_022867 [Perkinsus olseni]|uniref:Uncharacterized protein n=1 Tax=Perkinsus olseni TaxID=32597 RepID=A0A7J6R0P4_PEROL|nr:hypothetical protein FOZ63_022867 [Perkinsus olseni]